MFRRLLVLVFWCAGFYTAHSQAPTLDWVKTLGTSTAESVATDTQGNVYVSGFFNNTMDFDPGVGVYELTPLNTDGAGFITKLNAAGEFVWAIQVGANVTAVKFDDAGNLLVTGVYYGFPYVYDFDPGTGIETLTDEGETISFLGKYDTDGNLLWVNSFGYNCDCELYITNLVADIASDGWIYISYHTQINDYYGERFLSIGMVSGDGSSWGGGYSIPYYQYGSDIDAELKAHSIKVDSDFNVYVAGSFKTDPLHDPIDFTGNWGYGTGLLRRNDNEYGSFILKLTEMLEYDTVMVFESSYYNEAYNVNTDAANNVYVSGSFSGIFDADPGSGVTELVSEPGETGSLGSAYVIKFDASGNLTWARAFNNRQYPYEDFAYISATALNNLGEFYAVGSYHGTTDFDPAPDTEFQLAAVNYSSDIFLFKLDAFGNFSWAVSMGGEDDDGASDLALDHAGNIYVAGWFSETADLAPGSAVHEVTAQTGTDVFIQKLLVGPPIIPTITAFTPTEGIVGTAVTITGTNFSVTTSENTVRFNGVNATVTTATTTQLTAIVPPTATTGKITVTVNGNTATSATDFVVLPNIISFTPTGGTVGTTVTITGTTFSATISDNIVRFNGIDATVTTATTTQLTAIVPSTATTGKITVTVNGNTATSTTDFVVLPSIISFTPAAGIVGTTVTITGTTFSATISDNIVRFNGVTATVTTATTTELTAVVPPTATTGTITVTVNGNTATSTTDFVVLPSITSFTPTEGIVGTTVTITGTTFGATTSENIVQFNGVTATVTAATTTQLTAIVPSTATTGKITVTVNGNTATSTIDFVVLPNIISFTPTEGSESTAVTITGTGFEATPANNMVYFNGVQAVVSASTVTTIAAVVPVGATTGKISVTTLHGTAVSADDFVVTPPVPVITVVQQLQNFNACLANAATFTVTATGAPNLVYQWQFFNSVSATFDDIADDANYAGTSTQSLTVLLDADDVTGNYRCRISGDGAVDGFSNTATLFACNNSAPVISPVLGTTKIGSVVTINLSAFITDPEDNLDISTLAIVSPPISGADALISQDVNLVVNYFGIDFSGVDRLTVQVCDIKNACTQTEITIEVGGDIIVYNAVSPNHDGLNDFFYLQYIEVFEHTKSNRVSVFNRWGDLVFDTHDYDNVERVFTGESNDGKQLPSGTYFYTIDFKGKRSNLSGYLSLKR